MNGQRHNWMFEDEIVRQIAILSHSHKLETSIKLNLIRKRDAKRLLARFGVLVAFMKRF